MASAEALTALPSLSEPGKYLVGERIAIGGMAEVYRGVLRGATGFQRPVVVKKMLRKFANDRRIVRMFIEEARLAARLSHANLVQVLDFGRTEHEHFIVLEYVDGPDLRTLINDARARGITRLPVPIATYVITQLLKGLEYAHSQVDGAGRPLGCVHRDVSPSNVLLSRDGAVKLADFGVAKVKNRIQLTLPGQVKGKLNYLAPEQARSEEIDHRADLFAAGIVLYEMLTGRRPFTGNDPIVVVDQILHGHVAPPSTLAPEVPAELDEVLARALARPPQARFQDADQFSEALARAVGPHFPPASSRDLTAFIERVCGRAIGGYALHNADVTMESNPSAISDAAIAPTLPVNSEELELALDKTSQETPVLRLDPTRPLSADDLPIADDAPTQAMRPVPPALTPAPGGREIAPAPTPAPMPTPSPMQTPSAAGAPTAATRPIAGPVEAARIHAAAARPAKPRLHAPPAPVDRSPAAAVSEISGNSEGWSFGGDASAASDGPAWASPGQGPAVPGLSLDGPRPGGGALRILLLLGLLGAAVAGALMFVPDVI
jgi:serine/threonine-protein kinase